MPKGTQTAHDILALILIGEVPGWAKSPRYLSLHTAEPGAQDEHEVAYEGYRRQSVASAVWKRDEDTFSNLDLVKFPISVGSPTPPVTHIAIGTAATGAGQLLYTGRVRSPFRIRFNDLVQFEVGSLTFVET